MPTYGKLAGQDQIDQLNREEQAAAGGANEKSLHQKQETGEDYTAKVHTQPLNYKVFSDGSTRKWDDYKQAWVKQ